MTQTTGPQLTGDDTYFEDFVVGEVYEHARGKTVTEMDNVLLTNLVLNTAQGHFNEHQMRTSEFGRRITFGGITAALVIGLASQDTSENAVSELGLDKVRFRAPVLHGDTIYAFTEVLDTADSERAEAGVVRFRHWGVNQDDVIVFEGERRVLVKKRPTPAGP
jgi:itaconyl-CoA hydratase